MRSELLYTTSQAYLADTIVDRIFRIDLLFELGVVRRRQRRLHVPEPTEQVEVIAVANVDIDTLGRLQTQVHERCVNDGHRVVFRVYATTANTAAKSALQVVELGVAAI